MWWNSRANLAVQVMAAQFQRFMFSAIQKRIPMRNLYSLLFVVVALVLAPPPLIASQITPIKLTDLETRASHIVLGKMTKVVESGNEDTVTVEVATLLKGKSDQESFTFTLVTRGGIKDFDPAVKVAASGVFFLKEQDAPGAAAGSNVTKAYWGSVATFPKDHFK
jgi:hypothetical protein